MEQQMDDSDLRAAEASTMAALQGHSLGEENKGECYLAGDHQTTTAPALLRGMSNNGEEAVDDDENKYD